MKRKPTQILAIAHAAIGLALWGGTTIGQEITAYPEKVVRIVVPYPAGGLLSDVLTRAIGQKLSEKWNKPVVIENRPGANGIIGAEVVAKAPPDGYSLLLAEGAIYTINPSLYSKLPYDPIKDFAPITRFFSYGQVLVVHPSVPAKSLAELIAFAKAKPGALTYGSFGSGSGAHLNMEAFKALNGLEFVHVPYKGSAQAIADLLTGQLSTMFLSTAQSAGPVKEGKVRGLAIAVGKRSPLLPNVPTFVEAGISEFEATSWFGLVTSAGVPSPIINKIQREIRTIITEREFQEKWFLSRGLDPVGDSPEEFSAVMQAEITKWAKIVKTTGVKVD